MACNCYQQPSLLNVSMQRADFLENVLLIFPTLCWMGSEKHEKEEQWLRCWLAYYCKLLPYCLPSFSFNATAQEHTLHSLKEKGLYYFDGSQQSVWQWHVASVAPWNWKGGRRKE